MRRISYYTVGNQAGATPGIGAVAVISNGRAKKARCGSEKESKSVELHIDGYELTV